MKGAMFVLDSVRGNERVLATAAVMRRVFVDFVLLGVYAASSPDDEMIETTVDDMRATLFPHPRALLNQEGDSKPGRGGILAPAELQRRVLDAVQPLIASFLDDFRPRLIHSHDVFSLRIASDAIHALRSEGHPVAWFHDVGEDFAGLEGVPADLQRMALEYERRYLQGPDRLITSSEERADSLRRTYGELRPIAPVLNCPPLATKEQSVDRTLRETIGIAEHVPLAVCSAESERRVAVESLTAAVAEIPEMHLVFIVDERGDRPADAGLSDRIHWLPRSARERSPPYLCDADLGVVAPGAGTGADLCLPRELFEFLLADLPVAASDGRALRGLIDCHRLGETFDPDDRGDVASTIRRVLEQKSSYRDSVRACSAIAREYAWENQIRRLVDWYLRGAGKSGFEVLDVNWRARRWETVSCTASASEKSVLGGLPAKPRVLHGPGGSAGQPGTLAGALVRFAGLDAKSLHLKVPAFGYAADLCYPLARLSPDDTKDVLIAIADQFDVFHFHFRSFFYDQFAYAFPSGQDLLLLKAMGKCVIVHFRGTEVRLQSEFRRLSPYHYVDDEADFSNKIPEPAKRRNIKFAMAVSDAVLVTDPELQSYVPGATVIERAIDLDDWAPVGLANDENPVVLHAPSRRGVKGTAAILRAVENLKSTGLRFEFKLVEGLDHAEARRLYESCDIVVDQLRIGWYGVLAVEAMALGKAVVSYVRSDLLHHLPDDRPLAVATPDDVEAILESLIADRTLREQYARAGRRYCEHVHASNRVAEKLSHLYARLRERPRPVDGITAMEVIAEQWTNQRRTPQKPPRPSMDDDLGVTGQMAVDADPAPATAPGRSLIERLRDAARRCVSLRERETEASMKLPIFTGGGAHTLRLSATRPDVVEVTESGAIRFDCGKHPNVHLVYPPEASFQSPPLHHCLPFSQGNQYRLKLTAPSDFADLRVFVIFFDASKRIDHVSFDARATFTEQVVSVPRSAVTSVLALRLVGQGEFRLVGLEVQQV